MISKISTSAAQSRRKLYRPLVVAALAVSGSFQLLSPVLAEGTLAGTSIVNRATATYNDGTTNFNTISNTVTVTVAEVAGLIVADAGFNDTNGGSIATNDTVTFDFLVTNTGNASSYVFVPGSANLATQGGTISSVQVVEVNGAAITPADVDPVGSSTQGLAGVGAIAPDGNFRVRVTMTVTAVNAGDPISVQFGNTLDNTIAPATGTQNQQNIADTSDSASALSDLRTINVDTVPAVNGEREAAAFRSVQLSTAPDRPLAQTTILLNSTTGQGVDPDSAADDTVTYNLNFTVNNNPLPGFPAGDLEGTTITLNGTQANRILVSTLVPDNTVWNGQPITAPAGWTVVYSTSPASSGSNPLNVNWTTTAPADTTTVERIGFIYDAGANGSLPPGTSVSGFQFTTITTGLDPAAGGTVANLAQIFGETFGDATNGLVFDESGDQNANNYPDSGPTATPNVSSFNPAIHTGAANPADPDPGNNSGTGPDGESNVRTLTVLPPAAGALLNGPNGAPNALGPTNINDDFTNVAATVPVAQLGNQGTPSDPNAVTITNTVRNNLSTTNLDTVTLLPVAPSAALAYSGTGVFGDNAALPNGTSVVISYTDPATGVTQTATYTYDGAGNFTQTVGTGPVVLGRLLPGQQKNYTVTVDLPAGTGQIQGYTVPILSFVDNNGSGDFQAGSETVFNITNNRVYPGFVNLFKEAQILDASGAVRESWNSSPTVLPLPGEFVEYRISYQNVSEAQPPTGAGNVVLNANSFSLVEDGNDGTNTWANFTTHRFGITASQGTVQFFNGASVLGTTDPADGATVTKYINNVGTLAPGSTPGEFIFRRIVD